MKKQSIKPIVLCALIFFSSAMILAASSNRELVEAHAQTVHNSRASHPIKSSHEEELKRLHQAVLDSYNAYVADAPDANEDMIHNLNF